MTSVSHGIVMRMPAIVVDYQAIVVADLRFAGQLGFLKVRHADKTAAVLPICIDSAIVESTVPPCTHTFRHA